MLSSAIFCQFIIHNLIFVFSDVKLLSNSWLWYFGRVGNGKNAFETGLDSQHRNCNCKDPHCSTAGSLFFCNVIYWTQSYPRTSLAPICLPVLVKGKDLWKDYLAFALEDGKDYQKTRDWNRLLLQPFSSTLKHPALMGFSSSQWHYSNMWGAVV